MKDIRKININHIPIWTLDSDLKSITCNIPKIGKCIIPLSSDDRQTDQPFGLWMLRQVGKLCINQHYLNDKTVTALVWATVLTELKYDWPTDILQNLQQRTITLDSSNYYDILKLVISLEKEYATLKPHNFSSNSAYYKFAETCIRIAYGLAKSFLSHILAVKPISEFINKLERILTHNCAIQRYRHGHESLTGHDACDISDLVIEDLSQIYTEGDPQSGDYPSVVFALHSKPELLFGNVPIILLSCNNVFDINAYSLQVFNDAFNVSYPDIFQEVAAELKNVIE